MTQTALVTGASSGIGRELARCHAATGGDLILTARREPALMALKDELEGAYGIKVHVMALDLGAEEGARALVDKVAEAGLRVDILINNAGFGGQGAHIDRDLANEQAMIDLNIKALVALTHAFGAQMVAQGGGKILNVGSTAGFMPGPNQAIYFATKAFVNSFSQAVDQELRAQGVTCTVLAPGYVETEFADVANLRGTGLVRGSVTPDSVAKHGYAAMQRGALVTVNEWLLGFAVRWVIPFAPRRLLLKVVQKMQAK